MHCGGELFREAPVVGCRGWASSSFFLFFGGMEAPRVILSRTVSRMDFALEKPWLWEVNGWFVFRVAITFVVLLVGAKLVGFVVGAIKSRRWQMQVKAKLEAQGYHVLPCTPLVGNAFEVARITRAALSKGPLDSITHCIADRLSPPQCLWLRNFGPKVVFWLGSVPHVPVLDPEMVREIFFASREVNGKAENSRKLVKEILGRGIVMANGQDWHEQRLVVGPAFHADALKEMVKEMAKTGEQLVERFDEVVSKAEAENEPAEVEVTQLLAWATGDIIARTAFGGSYDIGKQAFANLAELMNISVANFKFGLIPGYKWLPVAANRRVWKLRRMVSSSLLQIIKQRRKSARAAQGSANPYGTDLLGLMLAAAGDQGKFDNQLLVHECKTFFVAGQETTSVLLTWAILLLALHPDWQQLVRDEAREVCQGTVPTTPEALNRLKNLGMVINEALRLYTPAPYIVRELFADNTRIGDVVFPAGVCLWIPLHLLHRDKAVWGEDADEFKPERFANGTANACKHPAGFAPFSNGHRKCMGGSFALMEAKLVLAALLQHFSFQVSPNYKHAPAAVMTLRAQFGVPVLVQRHKA